MTIKPIKTKKDYEAALKIDALLDANLTPLMVIYWIFWQHWLKHMNKNISLLLHRIQ